MGSGNDSWEIKIDYFRQIAEWLTRYNLNINTAFVRNHFIVALAGPFFERLQRQHEQKRSQPSSPPEKSDEQLLALAIAREVSTLQQKINPPQTSPQIEEERVRRDIARQVVKLNRKIEAEKEVLENPPDSRREQQARSRISTWEGQKQRLEATNIEEAAKVIPPTPNEIASWQQEIEALEALKENAELDPHTAQRLIQRQQSIEETEAMKERQRARSRSMTNPDLSPLSDDVLNLMIAFNVDSNDLKLIGYYATDYTCRTRGAAMDVLTNLVHGAAHSLETGGQKKTPSREPWS